MSIKCMGAFNVKCLNIYSSIFKKLLMSGKRTYDITSLLCLQTNFIFTNPKICRRKKNYPNASYEDMLDKERYS